MDNSLVDAHASDAAAVITTDGAGQASVDVTVVGACEGKAAGEVVNVPVTVATDFATVVSSGRFVDPGDVCGCGSSVSIGRFWRGEQAGRECSGGFEEGSRRVQVRRCVGANGRGYARGACGVCACCVWPRRDLGTSCPNRYQQVSDLP